MDTHPFLPKWLFQGISGPESSLNLGGSGIFNTPIPLDSLPSWIVLTAHKKWFHSEHYPPGGAGGKGGVQTSQKAEECLKEQINERSEGRLWLPIQVLGKGLSVVWWKGLDVGPEGESGSTCPGPPAAGGPKNNEGAARQWHMRGSWLQLIENRPFVPCDANVYGGPHGGAAKQDRAEMALTFACVCVRWSPLSLLFN